MELFAKQSVRANTDFRKKEREMELPANQSARANADFRKKKKGKWNFLLNNLQGQLQI